MASGLGISIEFVSMDFLAVSIDFLADLGDKADLLMDFYVLFPNVDLLKD